MLDLHPEFSSHLFTALLDLVAGILHEITDVGEVPLHNDLDIFLALVQGRSSLKFLVLLFEEEIELILLGPNHILDFLVSLLLELDPLIRCFHREKLPQLLVVLLVLAALEQ